MTELLQLVILTSLFCLGLNYASLYTPAFGGLVDGVAGFTDKKESVPRDREILWFIRYYTRNWPKYLTKPICGCVMCMASLYGSIIFWSFNYDAVISISIIGKWVLVVVATSGLNRVLKGIAQI